MTIQEDMKRRYVGKRIKAIDNIDIIGSLIDLRVLTDGTIVVEIKCDNEGIGFVPINLAEIVNDALPLPG